MIAGNKAIFTIEKEFKKMRGWLRQFAPQIKYK